MDYGEINKNIEQTTSYFASSDFNQLINTTITVLIVYFSVLYISLTISLFLIFKKEKIKVWYALIPFLNLYQFFKLIDIPGYLVFIPGINIIALYVSPYIAAREYKCNILFKILAFICPVIPLLYIAFNKDLKLAKYLNMDERYLKTVSDVDELELQLEANMDDVFDNRRNVQEKPVDDKYKSYIDNKIEEIENNSVKDDYYDDLVLMENQLKDEHIEEAINNKPEENINSLEITDLFENNDIRENSTIEDIVNTVDEASNIQVIDNAEYKEVEEQVKDVTSIAFGGINQSEEVIKNKIETKNGSIFCPQCSTMIPPNATACPGCGKVLQK